MQSTFCIATIICLPFGIRASDSALHGSTVLADAVCEDFHHGHASEVLSMLQIGGSAARPVKLNERIAVNNTDSLPPVFFEAFARKLDVSYRNTSSVESVCKGVQVRPLKPSQCAELVEDGSIDAAYRGWWNMPVMQSDRMLAKLKHHLEVVQWGDDVKTEFRWPDMRKGPAATIIPKMFEATKVRGVFDKMPEELQGIFWMKGNGIAEELAVLQYGEWFQEENMLYVPHAPFMWAWPAGKPSRAPFGGFMYNNVTTAMANAFNMVHGAIGLSFKFGPCKGVYCEHTRNSGLPYAYMQSHVFGDLTEAGNMGDLLAALSNGIVPQGVATGAFTLQEMPDSINGSHWKRTCHWGTGDCAFAEFGSYDLLKIIDGHGSPVEPAFTDFLDYMEDVPLVIWAGWKNGVSKKTTIAKIEGTLRTMKGA